MMLQHELGEQLCARGTKIVTFQIETAAEVQGYNSVVSVLIALWGSELSQL